MFKIVLHLWALYSYFVDYQKAIFMATVKLKLSFKKETLKLMSTDQGNPHKYYHGYLSQLYDFLSFTPKVLVKWAEVTFFHQENLQIII